MHQAIRHGLPVLLLAVVCGVSLADEYSQDERSHWSLAPRTQPAIPQLDDPALRSRVATAVDAFVFARLRQAGLRPAPEVDRATLIRRLSFDLTGLPPTPAEIESFVNDCSPQALERLVDRLLASPQYGEQWGQHWLDVVRYAETEGFEYDRYRPGAWRFRDYVIRAFNADLPYDRFVMEQLAGDELDPNDPELQIAAGFHRLGPVRRNAGNAEVAFSRNEVLTERTNIIGVALLGLTLGCARCHDHMYDPIRQTDYYRMQAFLAASHEYDLPLASSQEQARWQAATEELMAEIKQIKDALETADGPEEKRLREKLEQIESRLPEPLPTISTVRNQPDERTPIHLLERGDPDDRGQRVGPRALGVLLADGTGELPADMPDPRTQLARWLVDHQQPLAARVMANRVWQYHFGTGLVATPNDFGLNGEPPSHPELLDYLANELVASGWSIKRLHRLILLSSTYRQASGTVAGQAAELDPDNRLLWRFRRRRLTAGELRDAMLAASRTLDRRMGGPSVMVPVDQDLVNLLYKPSQWSVSPARADHHRRTVYLIAKRNLRLPFLEVFDQPDLQTSCACRESSTHAPQALEMLNGEFANRLARALAERLRSAAGDDPAEQVRLGFLLTAGRGPRPQEVQLAVAFLAEQPLEEFALAMFNLNAFLYVD